VRFDVRVRFSPLKKGTTLLRRSLAVSICVYALALPIPGAWAVAERANLTATAAKKRVVTVTKTASGQAADADRWGPLQVTITARKTTVTAGTKKTVELKITGVSVPTYPNHTDRSVYINQQALPLLRQETLSANGDLRKMHVVSGATATSYAFAQSLTSAMSQARQ
jgi:uncharacterized protein with FMN-binding domain